MPHGHVHVHTPHLEEGPGRDWLEIFAAVLLALATVASAWGVYQSARWGGYEAEKFAAATAHRVESTKAASVAEQEMAVDREIWVEWIKAYSTGQLELAGYIESKLFSKELKKAFEAWKGTDPPNNPDAPDSPFEMSAYRNPSMEKSEKLEALAQEETLEARHAIEISDRYVLFTVLFASVLFFAGISTKFDVRNVRMAVLGMGSLLFVVTTVAVALQPMH